MKIIEYTYCYINRDNHIYGDKIYNFTKELTYEEKTLMAAVSKEWIPNFNLASFHKEKGVVREINEEQYIDQNNIAYSYYFSQKNHQYVFTSGKNRKIESETFRGKKEIAHTIFSDTFEGYAIDLIKDGILLKNMEVEMNGDQELYVTDQELENKRFPIIDTLKSFAPFDTKKFISEKEKIICILSNLIDAKENHKKLYINYSAKENFESALSLLTCAIKLLPVSYANTISFALNTAECNNNPFDVILTYSKDENISNFIFGSGNYIKLASSTLEKDILPSKDNFIVDNLSWFGLDEIISYIDFIKNANGVNNYSDFKKTLNAFIVLFKEISRNIQNPIETAKELNDRLNFIKDEKELLLKCCNNNPREYESKLQPLTDIIEFVKISFEGQSIDKQTVTELFTNLIQLDEPQFYDSILSLAEIPDGQYRLLKQLIGCDNQNLINFIMTDGFYSLNNICVAACSKIVDEEIVNYYFEFYKKLCDEKASDERVNAVIDFLVRYDNKGFANLVSYNLEKVKDAPKEEILKIYNFIDSVDASNNQEEFKLTANKIFFERIEFDLLLTVLLDILNNERISNFVAISIRGFINEIIEKYFACSDDFSSIEAASLKFAEIVDKLNSDGRRQIEEYFAENILPKLDIKKIESLKVEYLRSSKGSAFANLVVSKFGKYLNLKELVAVFSKKLEDCANLVKATEEEKQYTQMRADFIVLSAKRLSEKKITKILDKFTNKKFTQDMLLAKSNDCFDFDNFVEDFVLKLLGHKEIDASFEDNIELSSEQKIIFASVINKEASKISAVDFKTVVNNAGSLVFSLVPAAIVLIAALVIDFFIDTKILGGRFKLLLTVDTIVVTIASFVFYFINSKNRRPIKALAKTIFESLITLLITFGIVAIIFMSK